MSTILCDRYVMNYRHLESIESDRVIMRLLTNRHVAK